MTSEPASVISHLQEPDPGEPLEAAKIPLRTKSLGIASQMQSVEQAGPDLASAVGSYSASVDQTLGVIEAIEATLQQKRRQIEEIQARQEILALEYRQLGRSLDTATKDLAEQFFDIIANLESDMAIAKPPAGQARKTSVTSVTSETSDAGAEPPADEAPETNETKAEPPADSASETSAAIADMLADSAPEIDEASGLDLETSDLPPVPEFLGGRQDSSDQMDDDTSRVTGSGPRGWWKPAKKG
jgi:chromosome segregation ATPase